jgi:hypothetical protein
MTKFKNSSKNFINIKTEANFCLSNQKLTFLNGFFQILFYFLGDP